MNFKKSVIIGFLLLLFFPFPTYAISQAEAENLYKTELMKMGLKGGVAEEKAKAEIKPVLEQMKTAQADVETAYNALEKRVKGLNKNDGRKEAARAALQEAGEKVKAFTSLPGQAFLEVQKSVGGALPRVLANADFELARSQATEAMAKVNQLLIAPIRPGAVPEGDLVSDFIPQLIRQFFRFAWLAVLISFTVSGVLLVLARDNEDRVSNAKGMIYYSIIGFAIITLAFALVKAITDIDFFAFI